MPYLSFRNVGKTFAGTVKAVNDFTLEIGEGELVTLVGPSGCGKSTLLRLTAGLEDLTTGEILLAGKPVHHLPPGRRDMAMMFQDYALFPHMTVEENMGFGLRMRGHAKREVSESVRETAASLGLGDLLARFPSELSGGQRQRTALGRAILRRPRVFLMDEPLSNLDAELRQRMRVELKELHGRLKTTMLFVTHDQSEAMTLGDRIVVLRDGTIQQVDTPLRLYNKPENEFVAGFFGSPGMNLLPGHVEKDDGGLWFRGAGFRVRIATGEATLRDASGAEVVEVTLGVRPEGFTHKDESVTREGEGIEGRVRLWEQMGSHLLLYLRCGSAEVVARMESGWESAAIPHVGEALRLSIDMAQAHFFAKKTGMRLTLTTAVAS